MASVDVPFLFLPPAAAVTAPSELVPSWTGGPGASSWHCSTAVVDQ